jgi:hypothetical protein
VEIERTSFSAISHFRFSLPWCCVPPHSHHAVLRTIKCCIAWHYCVWLERPAWTGRARQKNDCALTLAYPGLRRISAILCSVTPQRTACWQPKDVCLTKYVSIYVLLKWQTESAIGYCAGAKGRDFCPGLLRNNDQQQTRCQHCTIGTSNTAIHACESGRKLSFRQRMAAEKSNRILILSGVVRHFHWRP